MEELAGGLLSRQAVNIGRGGIFTPVLKRFTRGKVLMRVGHSPVRTYGDGSSRIAKEWPVLGKTGSKFCGDFGLPRLSTQQHV